MPVLSSALRPCQAANCALRLRGQACTKFHSPRFNLLLQLAQLTEWLNAKCADCGCEGRDHVDPWLLVGAQDDPLPHVQVAAQASTSAQAVVPMWVQPSIPNTIDPALPPPAYVQQAPAAPPLAVQTPAAPGLFTAAADRRQAAVAQVVGTREVANQFAHLGEFMMKTEPPKRASGSKEKGPRKKAKVETDEQTTVCLVLLPDTDHVNNAQTGVMIQAHSRQSKLLAIYKERVQSTEDEPPAFGRSRLGYTVPSLSRLAKVAELGLCVQIIVRDSDTPDDIHRKTRRAFQHVEEFPDSTEVGYRFLQAEDTSQGRPKVLLYYQPADPRVALVEPISGKALGLLGRTIHDVPKRMRNIPMVFLVMKPGFPNVPWHYREDLSFISKEDVRVYTAQKKGKGRKAVRREVEPDYEDDIIGAVDFKDGDSDAGSDSNTLADPDADYVHIGIGSPVRSAGPPSTRASTRASGSTAFSGVTKSNASAKRLTDAEILEQWGVEPTAPPVRAPAEVDQVDVDEEDEDVDWVLQFDAQYRANKKKYLTVGGQTFALVSNVVECEQSSQWFQQTDIYKKLERLYYACCTHARDLAYNEHRFSLLGKALEGFGRYSEAFPVKASLPLPNTAEFLALMELAIYWGQFANPGLVQHVELMQRAIEVLGRDWQKGHVGMYERAIRLRDELGSQLIALRTVVTVFKGSSILSPDDHPARVYLDRKPFSTLRIYLLCSSVRLSPSNGIRYAVTLLRLPKDAEAEGSSVDEFDKAFEADFGEPDDDFTVSFARLRAGISVPGEYKSPGLWDIVRDIFDVFLDEVPLDHPLHDKYGAIFEMWADVFLKTIDKHRRVQGLRPVNELEDYVQPRPVRDEGEAEMQFAHEPPVKAENDLGSVLGDGQVEAAQLGEDHGVSAEEAVGDSAEEGGEIDEGSAVERVAWGLEIPLYLGIEDRRKLREAAVISDVIDMAKYVVENWTDQFGPFPRSSSTAKWGKHFKGRLEEYEPGSPAAALARLIADVITHCRK
ncbi:hypothetical protein SISNIDRAFT_505965 [Sistotremastrum niveocremeum HHB9708]|uniref:Uncharacterized protein n=1 Tax=Sistotremastrum niveocremeum HHB9708 TaxID=1314777 RepID=A0A164V0E7_9AGAM|nr:hypothetical protein SISNIDRAFT_505965 [Sistotremastrum niveocremeum HHB9708]